MKKESIYVHSPRKNTSSEGNTFGDKEE